MNRVILIGRLTKDPELSYAPESGKSVCRFTLAVNRPMKKDEADFIPCVAFGKNAENISQYLTKGRQVAVNGNIRTGSYEGNDGNKKYVTNVWVDNFEFLGNNNTPSDNFKDNDFTEIGYDPDAPF